MLIFLSEKPIGRGGISASVPITLKSLLPKPSFLGKNPAYEHRHFVPR